MKTKIVIFGVTGDLSRSKLLPALADIVASGRDLQIYGVSRRKVELDELYGDSTYYDRLKPITTMLVMDLSQRPDYEKLVESIKLTDDEQLLLYFAVPPASSTQIAHFIAEVGLNKANVKLLFEKPFGLDLISAQQMIDEILPSFKEEQVYRIDHYMAKEVASQLIRLRSDADNHHHHWGKQTISSIEVITSEVVGIGHRVTSYEQTGALRDFIQCHNMQLLALVLMDIPSDFDIQKLAIYRLRALSYIKPADPIKSLRAQYEGYGNDVKNLGSLVETFASVQLESDDENWQGVSIVLTTGKNLDVKRSQIIITYRDGSKDVFDEETLANGKQLHSAYERVLVAAMDSEKAIFTSSEEVICSWKILQPIMGAWQMQSAIDLYKPGSSIDELLSSTDDI